MQLNDRDAVEKLLLKWHVCVTVVAEQHTLTQVEFLGSSLLFMSIVSSKCVEECPTTSITGHLLRAKHTHSNKLPTHCSVFKVNVKESATAAKLVNSLLCILRTTTKTIIIQVIHTENFLQHPF